MYKKFHKHKYLQTFLFIKIKCKHFFSLQSLQKIVLYAIRYGDASAIEQVHKCIS